MSNTLRLAAAAALVVLVASPVAAAKRSSSSPCGAVTLSVSVQGRDAIVKAAFESTCPDLDLEAQAQLWVDGQLVGSPVALDSADHVEIVATLPAADPAIAREVCLEVIGSSAKVQGHKIVTAPYAMKACQSLSF